MDKNEYRAKLEEINDLVDRQDYKGALKIVDTIDWRRVRSARTLCMVGEIYEANKRYNDSQRLLLLARQRAPIGKTVLYRLVELSIKMGNFDEAVDYYKQFVEISPNDNSRYILKYKIYRAKRSSIESQISILQEYKEKEYTERWAYELARLYAKAGMREACIEECDDLILWFSEGKYVIKAMELKMKYAPLTAVQQEKYDRRFRTAPSERMEAVASAVTAADVAATKIVENAGISSVGETTSEGQDKEIEDILKSISNGISIEESAQPVQPPVFVPKIEAPEDLQDKVAQGIRDVFQGKETAAEEEIGAVQELSEPIKPEEQGYIVKDLEPDELHKTTGFRPFHKPDIMTMEVKAEAPKSELFKAEDSDSEKFKTDITERELDLEALLAETANELAQAVAEETGETPNETESEAEESGENQAEETTEVVNQEEETTAENSDEVPETETEESEAVEVQNLEESEVEAEAEPEETETEVEAEVETDATEVEVEAELEENEAEAETKTEELETEVEAEKAEVTEAEPEIEAETGESESEVEAEAEELEAEVEAEPEETETETATEVEEESEEDEAKVEAEPKAEIETELEIESEEAEAEPEIEEESEELETPIKAEAEPEETEAEVKADSEEVEAEVESETEDEIKSEPEPIDMEGATKEFPVEEVKKKLAEISISEVPEQELADSVRPEKEESHMKRFTGSVPSKKRKTTAFSTAVEGLMRHHLTEEEHRRLFTYFAPIPGMTQQINEALDIAQESACEKTSKSGNIIVVGREGSGKTRLSEGLIKALCKERQMEGAKVAYITAEQLNKKDPVVVVGKLAGGFLVVENAGALKPDIIENLSKAMEFRTKRLTVILEDLKPGIRGLEEKYPEFIRKFDSRIAIPVFTNDELVSFAKTYAKELGYKIDNMAVLALYTLIGDNQNEENPVAIGMVREMMDDAIKTASRKGRRPGKKVSKRHLDESGRIMLYEKDFDI